MPDENLDQALRSAVREMGEQYLGRMVTPMIIEALRVHLSSLCWTTSARWRQPMDFLVSDVFRHKTDPTQVVIGYAQNYAKYPMTAAEFEENMGRPPDQDDLERVNCKEAGTIGHSLCGWCLYHSRPRFECGCVA